MTVQAAGARDSARAL